MPKRPYPSHQRRHDAILLCILEDPRQTQKEIAKATGYSASQVSRILSSPDFIDRYQVVFRDLAFGARSNWLASLKVAG
jgi:Winged helix-turn-helix DNA-binding